MKAFVISDIHGMYKSFEEILMYWNEEDSLILLGDLIDRGEHSLQVVQKVMQLQQQFPGKVIYLKGNHEDMLLQCLADSQNRSERYLNNGGIATIQSFIQTDQVHVEQLEELLAVVRTNCEAELQFLESGLLYYEFGNVLFTHAGFNSELENWRETSDKDFIWIRKHYEYENKSGLINLFGHTPVRYINEKDDIWVSPCGRYIDIDGACVYGGQLNALLISDEGEILQTYKVLSSPAQSS